MYAGQFNKPEIEQGPGSAIRISLVIELWVEGRAALAVSL